MKIYNKKGLIWGILWTAAGAFCLYRDMVDAHDFLPQQIKSVVLSLLMLVIGITGFVRAFSKAAAREDGRFVFLGGGDGFFMKCLLKFFQNCGVKALQIPARYSILSSGFDFL